MSLDFVIFNIFRLSKSFKQLLLSFQVMVLELVCPMDKVPDLMVMYMWYPIQSVPIPISQFCYEAINSYLFDVCKTIKVMDTPMEEPTNKLNQVTTCSQLHSNLNHFKLSAQVLSYVVLLYFFRLWKYPKCVRSQTKWYNSALFYS